MVCVCVCVCMYVLCMCVSVCCVGRSVCSFYLENVFLLELSDLLLHREGTYNLINIKTPFIKI